MVDLSKWVTTQEASKLTGYNAQHIRRLVRAGRVEAQKWGDVWMIGKNSLLEYIATEGKGPQPREQKSKS